MPDISVNRAGLPFVLGGATDFTVKLGAANPNQPLPRNVQAVMDVQTEASATQPVRLGGPGSWTMSLKDSAGMQLTAVWETDAALIRKYELQPFFDAHPGQVVLLWTVGASVEGTAAVQFRYAPLTATADLAAGTDLSFVYARGCDAGDPLKKLIPDFFSGARLPATITSAPAVGEVLHFEYGGYLNLGAKVVIGYEMTGTPSLDLGQLRLAEHYDLSLFGSVGLSAEIGGFFSVDIRAAADDQGRPMPGWGHVVVRRTRASEFTFAADASVKATSKAQKLPGTPAELAGALLGVNVKNWLNLLRHVDNATDWNQLTSELDSLALDFLNTWFGRTVAGQDLPALLAKVKTVVKEYDQIDATVVSAVDRLFDKISGPDLGNDVTQGLEKLAKLPSWDSLKGDVNPTVWSLLDQLTGGDPLGWITGKAVGALQERAAAVLSLGRGAAASELGALIHLAKSQFGIDALVAEARTIDTPAKLQAELKNRSGAFLQRLLGPEIATLSATGLGAAVTRVHAVLARIDDFEQQAYDALTDALTQSLSLDAHAEYSRASDDEALVDILVDATTAPGLELLQSAGRGDFVRALDGARLGLVRVNDGRLTRNLVKTRTLGVNVVGWHDGWHYKAIDQVILHADQQIVPDAGGGLTVLSTIDLTRTTDEERNRARTKARDLVRTNFLLRFIGESRGVLATEDSGRQYLIDTITRMSASYQLSFDDNHTTASDLAYYLGFARDFGLADEVQPSALQALLPLQAADDYGRIVAVYDVRYTDDGLRRLFTSPPDDRTVRGIMRNVILASYLARGGEIADEGWAYRTGAVYDAWKASPASFVRGGAVVYPAAPSPFPDRPAPPSVTLQVGRQRALGALYGIEDHFVGAFGTLAGWIQAGTTIQPMAFQQALGRVGDALGDIADFGESVNASYALFDALLMHAGASRASSLGLQSQVAGRTVKKVFVSA